MTDELQFLWKRERWLRNEEKTSRKKPSLMARIRILQKLRKIFLRSTIDECRAPSPKMLTPLPEFRTVSDPYQQIQCWSVDDHGIVAYVVVGVGGRFVFDGMIAFEREKNQWCATIDANPKSHPLIIISFRKIYKTHQRKTNLWRRCASASFSSLVRLQLPDFVSPYSYTWYGESQHIEEHGPEWQVV